MWRNYKGIGGVVRALLSPVLRDAMRAGLALTLIATAALCSGCIIPAPIEEEIPPEDLPPFVDQLNDVDPPIGKENIIDLELIERFEFFEVSDPNEDQTLYWRFLVEYGDILVGPPPFTIPPDERELGGTFQYKPCDLPHSFAVNLPGTGDEALVIIAVSDSPFLADDVFDAVNPTPTRLEIALETEEPGSVVPIIWPVIFEGSCPAAP